MPPPPRLPASSRSDSSDYGMQIFVQLPFGQTIQWMAGYEATIEGVKSVIEGRLGIPADQQRLAREVPNDRKVSDPMNVTNEIHFILLPIYQEPPPRKRKREMEEEEEEEEE